MQTASLPFLNLLLGDDQIECYRIRKQYPSLRCMTVAYAFAFLVLTPIGDVPNKYGFSIVLVFAFDICEPHLHGLSLFTKYK